MSINQQNDYRNNLRSLIKLTTSLLRLLANELISSEILLDTILFQKIPLKRGDYLLSGECMFPLMENGDEDNGEQGN